MGLNNFNLSISADSIQAHDNCARCGNTAEIYLTLLEETPQKSGSFCLLCGEALIHELQNQYAISGTHHGDVARSTIAYSTPHHDETEGGIIFWEGHGWSSDGPFAGA